MPQLDKFTYFTQFFWSCLFLFTFYIPVVFFIPNNWEARVYCFYITKPKWLRFLSFFRRSLLFFFFVRYGVTFYHNLYSILLDLSVCPVLPTASHFSGGSNSIVGVGSHEGSSSGWTSFDLDVLAEEEDEVARPLPNPIDPGTEDRIYRAVDAINTSCKNEEDRIVERARALLLSKGEGVFIDDNDNKDIARAMNMALYDAWETDIDMRLEQFRRIRRFLGKKNCGIWNTFIDSLVSLGNNKFDDAKYKK